MRKSFTRLLSLVMLFALLSSVVMAATGITHTTIWPQDPSGGKAWTKTTDKIMVIYSEAVKAGSGYVRLYENGSLSRSILATDSRISYAKGDTVVIDFSVDQKELKTYTVSIDEGTFKTVAASTPCSAIATSAWAYTVGDYTAPTLKSVDPVKGSIVDQTISLAMTFDDASSILKGDAGKIAVYKADGNVWDLIDLAHIGTHSATVSGSVLTVSGIRGLEDLTNYAVTIGAGVVTDDGSRADHEKNAFTGLTDRTVWTFTSKDFSAPGFADGYPKIGTVGVDSFDLLVKTTEAGKFYAVAGTTTSTVDASLLSTLTATTSVSLTSGVEAKKTFSTLSKNTKYYVYVVTENADKAPTVAAINGPIEVTTIDNDKPVLGFVKYFKGTTAGGTATVTTNTVANVLIDQKTDKIVFDFDGTIDKISVGSGSVVIYKKADNTVYTTIDAANISIDTNGNAVATISKAFENAANYYAFIPSTLFKDQYNNFYGGITTTTGWTFSTNDIVAPSIVSYTPAQGESGVAIDKNIVVKFSEVMDIPASGSTSATYFTLEVDGSTASYTFTHSTNNNAFSTVTISPTVTYASSAVVTLTVNGNIADASANHNKIGLTQGVSFVVKDIVGPKINTAKTKTPLAPADPIVFVFNEPVYLLGGTPITASNLYTLVTLKETDENGLNVAASYAISEDKTTITITPSSPLSSGKTYYVAISSDVQDIAGNKCIDDKADRSKSFTINDVTPATVTIDKDGKTDVSVSGNITISFKDENNIADPIGKLYYGGGWVDYSLAGMNNVIVFKKGDANGANVAFSVTSTDNATFVVIPSTALDGPSTYYIGVGASTKDGAGNVSAAKYASFSTVYAGAPKDFVLSPTDGQTEVALKAPVSIAFNTDISLIGSASYTGTEVTIFNVTTNASTTITYDKLSVSGKTLTIAHSDFVKNTDYYILIPAGVVLNKASNVAFGGITASTTWNFTSVDQRFEAFTLVPDFATGVALDAKLKIVVPEKVIAGTGNISIKNWDTDYLIEQIPSTSSQVAITYDSNTSTIAITPSAKFVYGGKYYVEVDNGAFTDTHANKIPAIVGKTESTTTTNWTFKAEDPNLLVSKVTPTGEHVTNSTDIVVTFNREIKKGTSGQVGFSEYSFSGAAKQEVRYGITSSNLIVSGNTLTIQHADKLFSNDSKVYLYIDANAIQSTTVTPTTVTVGGTYSSSTSEGYYFYVGDNLAPEATISPVWDNDKKIYSPVNTNITITFNEDVINNVTGLALTNDNVSAAGGIIQLLVGGATTTVDFTGTVSGRTITIDPTSDLAQSSTYSVTIVANKISDNADPKHPINADFTSIFKTTDTTLPVVVEATATPTVSLGIHQIAATVTITELNPNKIYYVLKKKTDAAPTVVEVKAGKNKSYTSDTNVALDVFSNLEASTEYVLYYVADDTFGNITTLQTKEVKTVDTVAPLLVSTDPVNGTVNVDNAKKITFTFNEAVQIGTGSVYIKDKATNSVISTIGTASMTVVANSSEKKVELTTGFSATMAPVEVYIEMDKGAIQDKATTGANDFAGIFGSDKVYFTYEDNTAPTLSEFTAPAALNSNIVLTFSENVQAGSGSAILYTGTGTSTTTAIEVFKGNEVAISGNTVTLNPTLNFDNSQPYTLDIAVGFVKDLSSNKNNNVASTVTFTTTEDVAPSVATVTPTEFTDHNKSELETIELKFSENVYLTIAGLNKSLIVLTEADIKSKISFTKADGTAVPFTVADKQSDYVKLSVASDDLAHLTSYILTVSGFKDIDGLVMETETFNYTTGDGKAPVITFNPAKDAKNVIGTNPLTLTFSETIYHGVTSDGLFYQPFTNDNVDEIVYLYDTTLGSTVSFDATFNGTNVITLTPGKALVSGHEYKYGLDPVKGIVTDIKGNTLSGTTSTTRVSFTVLDTEKPTFALETGKVSPAPSATKVIAAEKMWIQFNETVVVGTGSITIRYEDGTIFQTISGTSLGISADNDHDLTIAHKNFDSNATYFVEIGEGVVTDKAGNKNVALTDPTKWTFTTKDTFDLTANVTPLGTGTPRTVSLTLSFNKVPSVLVDNKFLAVYKADGTAVYQKAVNTMTVIGKDAIYSGVELEANQAYYARVEAGAFKDAVDGNTFAGIMDNSWAFSTVDNIAPKVVTLAPADNATGVDAQTSAFTMTFDRNIAVGTGLISVRYTNSGLTFEDVNVSAAIVNGMTLTFNVSKPLDAQTAYYVIVPVGAITNTEITKDPFAGILNTYTWNFTTSTDLTAPTATYSPNGTTAADNHPSLQMTFNEDVTVATGNVKIYKASDNVLTVTIPVTAAMLSGKTVSLTYAGGLDKNTDYYVLVDGGVVKDLAANAFAGVTATTTWTFKTGADFATPVVPVLSDSQFKVYPNPFVDYVTVSNASELSKVVVSNIAGQIVKEVVNPDGTIQLNELRSGVYFISLYQDGAVIKTVKLLKR